MEQPNLSYIQNMSGGDEEFEKKLIDIIKSEFPDEKAVYFENINSQNYKNAAENVHKLKHKISILGLVRGYEIAVDFENNLIDQSTVGRQDFEAVLQIMTEYLETL